MIFEENNLIMNEMISNGNSRCMINDYAEVIHLFYSFSFHSGKCSIWMVLTKDGPFKISICNRLIRLLVKEHFIHSFFDSITVDFKAEISLNRYENYSAADDSFS